MTRVVVTLVLQAGSLIDNPWGNTLIRAESAGEELAYALMSKAQVHEFPVYGFLTVFQGARPVRLIGFSMGARVIYFCLRALAKKKAFGLVQSVYLFGAPVSARAGQCGVYFVLVC